MPLRQASPEAAEMEQEDEDEARRLLQEQCMNLGVKELPQRGMRGYGQYMLGR